MLATPIALVQKNPTHLSNCNQLFYQILELAKTLENATFDTSRIAPDCSGR